jgi:hypothetical protein
MMRKLLVAVAMLHFSIPAAMAANITLKISNKTGVTINSITAAPKSGGATLSLTTAPIAAAAKPSITIAAGNDCVFTLTYTLASGKIIVLPDTDLCQTDQIMVE